MTEELLMEAPDIFEKLSTRWSIHRLSLAGGAVRDMLHSKPIKDLDIYIETNGASGLKSDMKFIKETFDAHPVFDSYDNLSPLNPILTVMETKDKSKQFILLNKVCIKDYIADYYDIGICETYMNGNGEVWVSSHYMTDVRTEHVALRPKELHSNHTIGKAIVEHLPRVVAKYPEYNPVIMPHVTKMKPTWSIHNGI